MDPVCIPKTHDQRGARELASCFKELAKELGEEQPILLVKMDPKDQLEEGDLLQVSFGDPNSDNLGGDHFVFMENGQMRWVTGDVTRPTAYCTSWGSGVQIALVRIANEYERLAKRFADRSGLVSKLRDKMEPT